MTKFIFVTGGVVSSLGKGITAASLGCLLKSRGYKVAIQKFDPYMNINPGSLSPYQHGEVFVTDDGAETDLDIGHYERFIDINLTKNSDITGGMIYQAVIDKERRGDFMGRTVQVIPHVTNEIKERVYRLGKESKADFVITEVGGTVGDIESLTFIEAIRQVKKEVGPNGVLYVHVTLLPYVKGAGELKTKPTQHSVKTLRSLGITPDILICRSDYEISTEMREKMALFCDVDTDAVFQCITAKSIYQVPENLEEQGLDKIVLKKLNMEEKPKDMSTWHAMVANVLKEHSHKVRIGLVGKYVELQDSYISLVEALKHACYSLDTNLDLKLINAENLEGEQADITGLLGDVDAILVPAGFGDRGVEGKIVAVEYARTHKIPYLGIGLGLQCAVIEFARHVVGYKSANSTEFNPEGEYPVVYKLHEPLSAIVKQSGGMRLGLYPCKITPETHLSQAYAGEPVIYERHRHRYEVNNEFIDELVQQGLTVSGIMPQAQLVEAVELPVSEHPYFVGVHFQPEFRSRPINPHPLLVDYIKAVLANKK